MPGSSVADVAREHGINANQVFQWRRLYRDARSEARRIDGQPGVKVKAEAAIRVDMGIQQRLEKNRTFQRLLRWL